MKRGLTGFFIVWICLLAQSAVANSSPLIYASSPYYPHRWLWEPITRLAPESAGVVSGSRDTQGKQLTVEAGGAAIFSLPAGYWLRLSATGEEESRSPASAAGTVREPPALWYSQGNGLYIPAQLQAGARQGEWLLPPVGAPEVFFRLENNDGESANWWLSRARPQTGADLYPYREIFLDQNDASQWYYRAHHGEHLQLARLEAGDDYSTVLQGPGEWRLEARILPDKRQGWQRFVDLSLKLDNRYWRDWRLHPRVDHHDLLESGQCRELGSIPESLYITLPAGEHRVSFSAPQAMAVRVMALAQNDFLFPRNQPNPGAQELGERFRLRRAPSAQPGYDEKLFTSLLSGEFPPPSVPGTFDRVTHSLAPDRAAVQLIEQRYRFWRPLPVANAEYAPGEAALIDVALPDPRRGDDRYVLSPTGQEDFTAPLLRLAPGRSIALQAPEPRPNTTLKLTLPISATPYNLTLRNRRGETTVWRWRPAMIQSEALDVANNRDLTRLVAIPDGSDVATASATFTVAGDDFPLSISHDADRVIWFSPFYRDDARPALDQAGWEHALDVLGADDMLALLLRDKRPVTRQTPTARQQLQLKVWDDWQPLRRWLHGYRQLWARGLSATPPATSLLAEQQLPLLTRRLDGDADHLLRQLLKGVVVRDPEAVKRQEALEWLQQHYGKAGDTANLSAFHSWQFHYTPREHMQSLADWLLTIQLEEMALRLYRLADTPDTHLPYQQARLDSGWQLPPGTATAVTDTWEAVWRQDWGKAQRYSRQLGPDHPWRQYLAKIPADRDPVRWLEWAQQAPADVGQGVPQRISTRLSASHSAGTLHFHVPQRDLHMQRTLSQPGTPVRYTVVGPVDLQLAISLHHSDPLEVLSDWVEIDDNGSKKWLPVIDSKANPGIKQLPYPGQGYIGIQRRVMLSLGPGRHDLQIRALGYDSLVDARVFGPLLLSNMIASVQRSTPVAPANTFTAGELVTDLDITVLGDCGGDPSHTNPSGIPGPAHGASRRDTVARATQWQVPHTLADGPASVKENPIAAVDVEQYLLRLWWQWPQTGDQQRRESIARANALAAPYGGQASIASLLRKLNQGYSWQLEETITASAGSRRIRVSGSTESPVLVEREKLLSGGTPPQGERLYGYKQIGFFTRFAVPTTLRLTLRQVHLPYREAPPARVLITLNDEPFRTVTLPPLQQQLTLSLPGGPQQLRLRLEQPSSDHWLYVQAHAQLAGQWESLLGQKLRRYHVATERQPLEFYLPEPRWIRVDEYRDGRFTHQYRWHAQAGPLQLSPADDRSRALYRVFSWRAENGRTSLQPYHYDLLADTTQDSGEPGQGQETLPMDLKPSYQWSPDQRVHGSAIATDGVYLQLQSRLDLDTDSSGGEDEEFAEAGWRHRRALDCQGCYWRSDLFARKHDADDIELVGTHQWLHGDWDQSSWRWALKQSLWLQTEPETDWSWHGSAAAINTHDINEKLQHEYKLQVFGRYLSADDPDYPVDNDIYTRYKDDHQYGLKLGATLRGRPWLDSLWTVNAALSTNEDFNPLDPDYAQASVAWRQYWRPLAFTTTYRHRTYFSDDDRDKRQHRPALGLAVNTLSAFPAGQLLQWGARLDYDLDRGEYGFFLSLSWDQSRGRGLRDFYPGRSSFHSLRSRDIGADLLRHQMINGRDHVE